MQDKQSTEPGMPSDASNDIDDQAMAEIDALAEKLGNAENTIIELRDTMLRDRADLENQRRRMQTELDNARRFANQRLLGDLLPVFDGLEHGLAVDTDNAAALREGMQLTLRSLLQVTDRNGLKQIDPVGQPFDPELHQAMNMVPTAEQPPDTVVSVMQKGYLLNDRLLRPALVAVATDPG